MTRLFLAAGVATLAIAVPATAGPPDHGDKNKNEAQVDRQSADRKHAPPAQKQQQPAAARVQRQAAAAPPIERPQQRVTANERPQRPADVQPRTNPQQAQARIAQQQQLRANRQQEVQARVAEQQQVRAERQQQMQKRMAQQPQIRANRQQVQTGIAERQQIQATRQHEAETRLAQQQQIRAKRAEQAQNTMRAKVQQQTQTRVAQQQQMPTNRAQQAQQAQQIRVNRMQQGQTRTAQQQQMRMKQQQAQAQIAQQQPMRANRQQQIQGQIAQQQQMRANNVNAQVAANRSIGYGVGGCPPGLAGKNCMPPGQAAKLGVAATVSVITAQNAVALRSGRVDELNARLGTRLVAPFAATSLIGAPVTTAPRVLGMALNPVPQAISYLYPATPQYYYQYAPGYVYQVNRSTSLIEALIPLLAGGYMPGSYLPSSYMDSYVPDNYGYNSFYPSSYGADYGSGYGANYGYGSDYGYGADYANLCNRYAYGVIYQVDCTTGMVENVIPTYAGGYGVGQMLPASYSYYNVPMQYRSMYYPTADYSYWYAPGAIYQYDPSTSLITSVAALMSPGFSIGQQLPMGYDAYNVPMQYRSTYYDTPDAWYRYNNGYIYQVNPTTQLVTAIVASLLTSASANL